MSAPLYVRQAVKGWASALNIPFYPTVNEEQKPTDPMWCTVFWEFSDTTKRDYCGNVVVNGTFTLLFFGVAGIGEEPLIAAAELEVRAFMANNDNHLTLLINEQAEDFQAGGDAPWYGVAFRVEYEYTP